MQPDIPQTRLLSLDTYRGIIMVTLAFTGFGLAGTARNHIKAYGSDPVWDAIYFHTEHAEWTGGGYWDMIQPSFMFMVGAAMAYSYGKRKRLGQSYGQMLVHAITRSFVLIFLGILLAYWRGRGDTLYDQIRDGLGNWGLMNVLTQIGLGYTFLFLLWNRPTWVQASAAVGILVATWALYVGFAGPGIDLLTGAPERGVKQEWAEKHLTGIDPAWHKNANVGHDIDVVLLNGLPRKKEFVFSGGGYQTINFIPSLATMIFGLMAGELLRGGKGGWTKVQILTLAGIGGVAVGQLLDMMGWIPLVKRIWTPSWALYSSGWCCLILAGLFAFIDLLGYQRWTFPLVVVGMNSIAIYAMSMLLRDVVALPFKSYFGNDVFTDWAGLYAPMLQYTMAGMIFWLACYVMYRWKIFVRI